MALHFMPASESELHDTDAACICCPQLLGPDDFECLDDLVEGELCYDHGHFGLTELDPDGNTDYVVIDSNDVEPC